MMTAVTHIHEFKLRQHSPLIHFQHAQYRACPRASEVKAKLDRFVMQSVLRENKIKFDYRVEGGAWVDVHKAFDNLSNERKEYTSWIIKSPKGIALNYKLSLISPTWEQARCGVRIITEAKECGIMLPKNLCIQGRIICFVNSLSIAIRKNLKGFFILNNFGKRQSKGFGGYLLQETETAQIKTYLAKHAYDIFLTRLVRDPFKYDHRRNRESFNFYLDIEDKWRRLKSGGRGGVKGRIFEYAASKQMNWGKRWVKRGIKEWINNYPAWGNLRYTHAPYDWRSRATWQDNDNDYRLFRAMLGLAEHYEYRSTRRCIYQASPTNNHELDRFQAPVIFKVCGDQLYVIVKDIPKYLYDKGFSYGVKRKLVNPEDNTTYPLHSGRAIRTPAESEFDLREFLRTYLPTVGFKWKKASE